MYEILRHSEEDTDLISDFEGSDLSSLEDLDVPVQNLREPRSQSTSPLAQSPFMDDAALLSDASSLTDIVSKWSTDKSTDSLPDQKEKSNDSPLSSLTSEDTQGFDTKPNRAPNRVKRLNLQQKLDLSHPNTRDRAGRTQLFRYAERGDLETCRKLLDADADVNVADNAGWRPLHLACARGASAIVQLFLERGADPHARGLNHQTALHDAALSGDIDSVRQLVKLGADITARNVEGYSPMDLCSHPECLAFMMEQLDTKREINSRNRDGYSRLHMACIAGDVAGAAQLLLEGADVNAADSLMATPMHLAAQHGHLEIIAALVKRGALIDLQDCSGNTSLHLATQHNQLLTVKLLLENRSNPLVRNRRGLFPMDLCKSDVIAGLLRDHIIAYSTRAMDMDVLLPRASKIMLADNIKGSAKTKYSSPPIRPRSKLKMSNSQIMDNYLAGLQPLPKNHSASSPSQVADPYTPNSGSLDAFLEDPLMPPPGSLYCIRLPTALQLGYMVLDLQIQLFLRLPHSSLLSQYPRLTYRRLTIKQKERMWPVMHRTLKVNCSMDRKQFLAAQLNFVRWQEVAKLVAQDYSHFSSFLVPVPLDINYSSSLSEPGPSLSGDEGFPPEEVVFRDSTSSEASLPTPPVRRPTHSELDLIQPSACAPSLASFLQRHPRLNPRSDLPLKEAARFFISRTTHPYRP